MNVTGGGWLNYRAFRTFGASIGDQSGAIIIRLDSLDLLHHTRAVAYGHFVGGKNIYRAAT
jgi:hypothetical protein